MKTVLRKICCTCTRIILWPVITFTEGMEKEDFRRDIEEYKRIEHIQDSLDIPSLNDAYNNLIKRKRI